MLVNNCNSLSELMWRICKRLLCFLASWTALKDDSKHSSALRMMGWSEGSSFCFCRFKFVTRFRFDRLLVLAMCCNQQLSLAEYLFKCQVIINQKIPGWGAHENLYATYFILSLICLDDFFNIIIRSTHEKRIIGKWGLRCNLVFVFQQLLVNAGGWVLGISMKDVTPPATAAFDSV